MPQNKFGANSNFLVAVHVFFMDSLRKEPIQKELVAFSEYFYSRFLPRFLFKELLKVKNNKTDVLRHLLFFG